MNEYLIQDKVIDGGRVHSVALVDITKPGTDGRDFKILIVEQSGDEVPNLSRKVGVSGTFLSMTPMAESDLANYLVQFRKELPDVITSATPDVFTYPDWPREFKIVCIGQLLDVYFRSYPSDELSAGVLRNSVTIEFFEILSILEYYESNEVVYRTSDIDYVKCAKGWHKKLQDILADLRPVSAKDKTGIKIIPKPVVATFETLSPEVKVIETGAGCQAKNSDGKKCPRSQCQNGYCIGHLDDPDKDLNKFNQFVDDILSNKKIHDFTNVVFPTNFNFESLQQFTSPAVFMHTEFSQYVSLRDIVFRHNLKIRQCEFKAGVSFQSTIFERDVEFVANTLNRCNFQYASFKGALLFQSISPIQGPRAEIDFRDVTIENPSKICFRNIHLPSLRLTGTNVSNIHILNMLRPFETADDLQIGDEYALAKLELNGIRGKRLRSDEYRRTIETYGRLQVNLISSKAYEASGYLYVREMELRRDAAQDRWRRHLNWATCYKYLSNYGESISRPLLSMLVLLVVLPLVLTLWMGDNQYDFTGDPSYALIAIDGWAKDAVNNVQTIFTLRDSNFAYKGDYHYIWHLVFIIEKLLFATLVSFTVIAFRRRFKRF